MQWFPMLIRPAGASLFLLHCITLTLILSACAQSPKYLTEMDRESLGHVGVVSAQFQPEINLTLPAKGAGSGAWRGAREGAKDVIIGSAVTPLPGAIFLGILLSPFVAAGGAVYGAIAAPPAKDVARHEKTLAGITRKLEINRSIREGIIQYANEKAHYSFTDLGEIGPAKPGEETNYLRLALNGSDTVLEVSASDLSTEGAAINSPFRVVIKTDMRLIRTEDGRELASYHPRFASQLRTLQAWAQKDGALFRKALQKGFMQISRETVYELLLVYDPDSGKDGRHATLVQGVSVRPPEIISPKPKQSGFSLFSEDNLIVGTLTPEFCWKPFADVKTLSGEGANMSGISHISYQFEIKHDDEVVYEQNHLEASCHRLQQALKWNTEYTGLIRMWFELGGHIRATRPGEVHFKTPPVPVSQFDEIPIAQ